MYKSFIRKKYPYLYFSEEIKFSLSERAGLRYTYMLQIYSNLLI